MSGYNSCIDDHTDMPIRIDYAHHEIHEGNAYFIVHSELLDNTETAEVRFQTPNSIKVPHMEIITECALAATVELFVDTTMTHNSGNAITPFNRYMDSSNTSGLTVCHTPSGSQAGTGNILQYIGSANAGGFSQIGGSSSSRQEILLENNTAFLLRVTSRANGNAVTIFLDWYEHTPKNL